MSRSLFRKWFFLVAVLAGWWAGCSPAADQGAPRAVSASGSEAADGPQSQRPQRTGPYVVVLGIAQDAGIPQVGSWQHPAWQDVTLRRRVTSLGLVDPATGHRWLFDATPDLRAQLADLTAAEPPSLGPANGGLTGVFLTHAHMGHYAGLLFLGHESMGARNVDVYAMPRFKQYLEGNGPWDQLVRYNNIRIQELAADRALVLPSGLRVTPLMVPHRQEYSEVVGFRIEGAQRSVLYLPDIDSWEEWDDLGVRLEDVLETVDVAYLDATFFADGEIPGRDMSGFPHPFIRHTMDRLSSAPEELRAKVRFIHLNHTNPAQYPDHEARRELEQAGFAVAEQGEVVMLSDALP